MREFSQLCHSVAVAYTQETLNGCCAPARSSHQPPCPLSVCVCVPGASAAAVQIDFHSGRAGAQRERHSRTVPPSRHVGEPIAAEGTTKLSTLTLPDPRTELPVSSPTEITLYLLLILFFFFSFSSPRFPPGFTHYSLGVPSVCLRACVCFVRMCFALNHPRVLFGLVGRTWKRGLAAASRKSSPTCFPTKKKKKKTCVGSFLSFLFSSDLRRPVHLNLPPLCMHFQHRIHSLAKQQLGGARLHRRRHKSRRPPRLRTSVCFCTENVFFFPS